MLRPLCVEEASVLSHWNPQFKQYDSGNLSFISWHLGGTEKIKPLFRHWYPAVEALVFVVDSSDHAQLTQATCRIHEILNEGSFCAAEKLPVLVLGTKIDIEPRLSHRQLWNALHLDAFSPCNSPPGLGCYEVHLHLCNALVSLSSGNETSTEPGWAWLQQQIPDWKRPPHRNVL